MLYRGGDYVLLVTNHGATKMKADRTLSAIAIVFLSVCSYAETNENARKVFRNIDENSVDSQLVRPTRPEFTHGRLISLDRSVVDDLRIHAREKRNLQRNIGLTLKSNTPPSIARLTISIPENDDGLSFETESVVLHENGVSSWRGRSSDGKSRASLTMAESGQIFGRMSDGRDVYIIVHVSGDIHYVAKIGVSAARVRDMQSKKFHRTADEYKEELERARIEREIRTSTVEE